MVEIYAEVSFHDRGFYPRRGVIVYECFCESVEALVVFVFEARFSENVENVFWRTAPFFVLFEVIPDGVSARGAAMASDDFGYDCFPPFWPAVNPSDWRGEVEISARRFVRFESDLGFEATLCANDCTII